MIHYLYDIEVTPNFFCATFISASLDKTLIDEYIATDIKYGEESDELAAIKAQINPIVFEISERKNQYEQLCLFMQDYKTLIGYNNKRYDDWIIASIIASNSNWKHKNYVFITNALYQISYKLIHDELYVSTVLWSDQYLKMAKESFDSIDLMKLHYLDHYFVSLKQVGIHLKWYNILDYSPNPLSKDECLRYYGHTNIDYVLTLNPFDRKTCLSAITHMIYYNLNDVLMLYKLYWNGVKELVIRYDIKQVFGIKAYSASRSSIANILMTKFYGDRTKQHHKEFTTKHTSRYLIRFNDILSNKIQFKTPELNNVLSKIQGTSFRLGIDKFIENVKFKDTIYTLATGGLHSQDKPMKFETTDKFTIRDADVTSFYPSIIINMGIAPAHLNQRVFLEIFENIVKERIDCKVTYPAKAEVLKIVINVVYGKFGEYNYQDPKKSSWMSDIKCTYQTTLNGQLFLMMLIEMLELRGIKVISANTDGIVCKIPNALLSIYHETCKEWEDKTKLNLEYADYSKYIRTTVNDYIAVKKDGKIKSKGDFLYDAYDYKKGFVHPVVCKALEANLIHGTDVRDFIHNHTDIYDFCMSQRIGRAFKAELHSIDPFEGELVINDISKNIRFYVANSGSALLKKGGDKNNMISLVSGQYVRILNRYVEQSIEDYDIKYSFYINRVYKLLNQINNVTLGNKTISKKPKTKDIRGGMFDEHFNI